VRRASGTPAAPRGSATPISEIGAAAADAVAAVALESMKTPRSPAGGRSLSRAESMRRESDEAEASRRIRKVRALNKMKISSRAADSPMSGGVAEMRSKIDSIRGVDFSRFVHREIDASAFGVHCATRRSSAGLPPMPPLTKGGALTDEAERDAFETKRRLLHELVSYINSGPSLEQRDILDVLTISLEVINRAPPPPVRTLIGADGQESVHSDMMWTHVSLGYELLLRLLYHPRMTKAALQPLLNKPRLRGLLDRFLNGDARERDYVKTAVFRAYAILVGRRMFIRRHIRAMLTNFAAAESEKCASAIVRQPMAAPCEAVTNFFGVQPALCEVLEFCCSIAAGLNVPLKDEHVSFLLKVLVPLHNSSDYPK